MDNYDMENFRMFYKLQYERIDKLEMQKNYVTTAVTCLGIITIFLAFNNLENLTHFSGLWLPIILIIANIFAIIYIKETKLFIKNHQRRAEKASEICSPILNEIRKKVPKHTSEKNPIRRSNLHKLFHLSLILIGICIIFWYLYNTFL